MATVVKKSPSKIECPCGTGKSYADCCGRYLDIAEPVPNAEALMRSRYTAYTLLREDYLLATWHPSTRPQALNLKDETPTQWMSLEVIQYKQQDTNTSQVEFLARYKTGGRAYKLHELSRFLCDDGHWLYVDGEIFPS